MRWLAAISCVLALGIAAGVADAAGVVPAEGPWHATTSAGLPVGFEVTGGQVIDPRWRFRWGYCGSFENDVPATVPVNSDGYWKFTDERGPWIEGTFVAPDRLEGTVTAPARSLPGCPETHATFVAEPGAASFERNEAVVLADVVTRRLASAPKRMRLRRDGSLLFYGLVWQNFGDAVARAAGRAFLRHGCHGCRDDIVRRPRVVVYLNELTRKGMPHRYLHAAYRFVGPIPPGFSRQGSRHFAK
jgi:hypothetical protein